nr:DNA methyltransferase [Cognatishimia sp. MH4019]
MADQPYDAAEFPFAFLECFDNSDARSKKLRKGTSNKSDINGVLQVGNIHIKTCDAGRVPETLTELRDSKATQTKRNKVRFVLATDGQHFEAEDLITGDIVSCTYDDFPNHFVFFWPLAGLSKTKQLSESEFDVRATLRLNKLYVTLRSDNPDWGTPERRHEMNHFMARLIFLFFAEDTDILVGDDLFTSTVEQMANRDGSNTHEVIGELFRAMNTPIKDRASANLPRWADAFPYVNGGLFSGSTEVPRFSLIAQRYLIKIGNLNWQRINPDIFGSMIQAVADDEERSKLGMHYTSVPNILKVLNPLFLDDLNDHLDRAGDSPVKLLNLRKRMSNIRVFDPACGSGNFLVIAYKQMREIEFEINKRRGEADRASDISIQNFRGIELRDFSAEIARLALIIAEYQCDVLYRGPKVARDTFLPLDARNWITQGNALRLDWLDVCPPTTKGVKLTSDDLFDTPLEQAAIDFENEGGETYICGNPPYQGSVNQTAEQKEDMKRVFAPVFKRYKDLDFVAAFMLLAARYNNQTGASSALVTTNSIAQGEQVAMLWPLIFQQNNRISFAHNSFLWSNLASNKAAVTCIIVGLSTRFDARRLYEDGSVKTVHSIGPYLIPNSESVVTKRSSALHSLSKMDYGNKPTDGGNLILNGQQKKELLASHPQSRRFFRNYVGSQEFIRGGIRHCLWIDDSEKSEATEIGPISKRVEQVRQLRIASRGSQANKAAQTPHRFVFTPHTDQKSILVPRHFSENREYLTVGYIDGGQTVIADSASAIYNATLVDFSVLSSALHLAWTAAVGGRIKSDYRYSSTLVWNTFPVPKLTEKNKADLTRCAEDILLAREAHFPATIADLYKPDAMPENLRAAHDRNDEVLERIYIGRRFRNDTERLEKLFEMYTKMTTKVPV